MSDNSDIRKHIFEPGAMSIIQMGEELIGHPTTAINELVKNGYDADATECKVYINQLGPRPFMFIFDNGLGMDNSILFGPWLQPSISSKRKEDAKSEIFERNFLGSKGIGRLAAMALGKLVTVVTKTSTEKDYNWISLDKEKFRDDSLLSSIEFPGDKNKIIETIFLNESICKERWTNPNPELVKVLENDSLLKFNEGTLIVIEDLDESIIAIIQDEFENNTENELKIEDTSVFKSLAVLITPLELNSVIQTELYNEKIVTAKRILAKTENLFSIYFGIDLIENEKKADCIEWIPVSTVPIFKAFDYRIFGKVSSEGDVVGKFVCKRLKEDSFVEDFLIPKDKVFDGLNDKINKRPKQLELGIEDFDTAAGEFYFDIRVYDRGEDDSMERLMKILKADKISQARLLLNKFLGLRISKNGFGVKPYGEENKDWLGLGQIRVQDPGGNVSVNQILGYIFFYSPQNDGLKEKTNREGFYENKAFIQVKTALQSIFKNIGDRRYRYRRKHNLGDNIKSKHSRPDIENYKAILNKNDDVKIIRKESEKFILDVTTALDNLEGSLTFSQRLATLGTGAELIYHEMAQPLHQLNTSRASLDLKKGKIEPEVIRNSAEKDILFIASSAQTLVKLREALKPAIGKSRKAEFKPVETFLKVCRLFQSDIEEYEIKIEISTAAQNFEINDLEYPFWISFLNIMNNAVYWLKQKDSNRKLTFTLNKFNAIIISNTGPLIPEDDIELIFEYGVTHRKEKSATGLGLAFTRSILSLNEWNIKAENWNDGPAFTISKKTENG
ncbi:MAG: ATP-binding protein [Ferruginibacter sp.]